MRVYPEKLAAQYSGQPPALVWIAIGDPLLGEEACDSARTAAKQAGFLERKVFHCDKLEHWHEAIAEANALSLFADKSLIELRASPSKIEHALLIDYLKQPSPDNTLLLITDKVENASQETKWFTELEKLLCFVPVTPLDVTRFPEWLATRAKRAGVTLERDALNLLVQQTQGNLLAASQEIEKLALQFGEATISASDVEQGLTDSAQFEMFSLNDAILAGERDKSLRILNTLLVEGEHPLAMLGALGRELRQLAHAKELIEQGHNPSAALTQLGVWDKRKPLFNSALNRLRPVDTRRIIQLMADCDLAVKGMNPLPPAAILQQLILCACQR